MGKMGTDRFSDTGSHATQLSTFAFAGPELCRDTTSQMYTWQLDPVKVPLRGLFDPIAQMQCH